MKVENEQRERMESTMKKLMVTWFMLCMIGVLLPDITAKAATEGDYEYTVLEDDTVEITKYNGTATTLTIPSTLDGKPVTRIADFAFEVRVEVSPGCYTDASTVTSVVFPETLTYIGNWNFYQLTSIHIPASLTTIGSRAFGMEYVESITVDENNAVYDSRENCNAIVCEGIDAETGVNKVELVLGCNTSTIPYGVTCIGSDAFSGCTFETITIPESANITLDLNGKNVTYNSTVQGEAMITNKPYKIGGNVINRGLITNLPHNACVEVPCLVNGAGIHPTVVGDLPEVLAAMNRTNINPQLLTIEAAVTKKKDHIYQAAMLDPHTGSELSIDDIVKMVDELIEVHGDWMPKYN